MGFAEKILNSACPLWVLAVLSSGRALALLATAAAVFETSALFGRRLHCRCWLNPLVEDVVKVGALGKPGPRSLARRFANSRHASALRGWLENAASGLAPLAGRGCYLKVLRTGASHLHLRRGVAIPRQSSAGRNRVINPQHYDCSDNGHDDAADINTGYAWAT